MRKFQAGVGMVLWAGIRASIIPLAYDAFLSLYAGRFGFHAPFLYPICFLAGAILELDGIRKRRASK